MDCFLFTDDPPAEWGQILTPIGQGEHSFVPGGVR
jgi:hypothetical protein